MLHYSNFDDVACITNGITVTNPAMVARIRAQSAHLTDYDIAAHLGNAIASSTDAAHSLAWEESQFGEARAETLVDAEYFDDLVAEALDELNTSVRDAYRQIKEREQAA